MLASLSIAFCLVELVSALPRDMGQVQELERRQLATVITHCTMPNTVALTFDDGPYNYTYAIDGILRDNGAFGTFFFNGNNRGCIYAPESINRVKFVYGRGHQIASHTWFHKNLTTLTWDQVHDEMWRVEQALVRITGAYPAFTRPPYGAYNDLVRRAFAARRQGLALWDFEAFLTVTKFPRNQLQAWWYDLSRKLTCDSSGSRDTMGATVAESKALYHDLATRHPSNALALNHETSASTIYDVLPYAVQELRARGYALVTLAQCLGAVPYQSVSAPQTPTADWHC